MTRFNFSGVGLLSSSSTSSPLRPPDGWLLASIIASLLVGVILWPLVPAALPNGDAAVYSQQIQQGDLVSRPTHRGYFMLMWVLNLGRDQLSDQTLNRLHLGFGIGSVFLLASMACYLTGRWQAALMMVPLALGHFTWLQNVLWAEVYGPQAFFLIAALWLSWVGRSALAAGCLAMAVLITPSSLLAVPAIWLARPTLRHILVLGGVGGGFTLLTLAPVGRDYLWGDRGLLKASQSDLSWPQAMVKEGFEGGLGLMAFAPLLLVLPLALLRRPKLRPAAWVLPVLWLPNFLLGERFQDVPVQLTLWYLTLVATAVGLDELVHRLSAVGFKVRLMVATVAAVATLGWIPVLGWAKRTVNRLAAMPDTMDGWIVAAAVVIAIAMMLPRRLFAGSFLGHGLVLVAGLLINGALCLGLVRAENLEMEQTRRQALEIDQTSEAPYVVVGGWSRGILFEHYVFAASYTETWVSSAQLQGSWGPEEQRGAESRLIAVLEAKGDVWLLAEDEKVEMELLRRGYELAPALAAGARLARFPSSAIEADNLTEMTTDEIEARPEAKGGA